LDPPGPRLSVRFARIRAATAPHTLFPHLSEGPCKSSAQENRTVDAPYPLNQPGLQTAEKRSKSCDDEVKTLALPTGAQCPQRLLFSEGILNCAWRLGL
jgi:hypothetical protein